MSEDEELPDVAYPVTLSESMFIELHVEYEAAVNAGFTKQQAFHLIAILFESRVQSVFNDVYQEEQEDE